MSLDRRTDPSRRTSSGAEFSLGVAVSKAALLSLSTCSAPTVEQSELHLSQVFVFFSTGGIGGAGSLHDRAEGNGSAEYADTG